MKMTGTDLSDLSATLDEVETAVNGLFGLDSAELVFTSYDGLKVTSTYADGCWTIDLSNK